MIDDRQRELLRSVEAGEALRHAASAAMQHGIRLMPLKGVWLQHVVYPEPWHRSLTDVDVLAPAGRFDDARVALERDGFRVTGGRAAEVTLVHPRHLLPIDLHRDLFTRGAFAMDTAGVFARGRADATTFGVELCLPDPRDALGHLIGHLVKSRGAHRERYAEDFRRLARMPGLDAAGTARHLETVGLGRAARMALPVAADEPAVAALLAALAPDLVGELLARLARRAEVALAGRRPWEALPSFLVDRSLAAGARALVLRYRDRSRDFGV